MADISKDDLKKEIAAILKDADLTKVSAKKVREKIEEKLDYDLSSRKKEIDDLVMQCLKEKKGSGNKSSKKNGKKDSDDEGGDDGEEEEEEDEEEEGGDEDGSEEEEKPKRAAKKPTPKRKKGSSEESEEEDNKDSDDEYSPAKKAKGKPKGKGRKKKKGSDSDSDEDWGKGKAKAKKGGGANIDQTSLKASIEKVAQCPICLELLKPPVTLCVNGHGTCTECKGSLNLTKCSICRQPYCNTEQRVLNEILLNVHKVCPYYDAGCRNKPAADDHELYCEFRTVKCIFHNRSGMGYCDWEGPAKEFDEHAFGEYGDQEDHEHGLIKGTNTRNLFKIHKFKDFCRAKSLYTTSDNLLFIFTHVKINRNFCLYVHHIPLGKPAEIYYFNFYIKNRAGEVLYKYRARAQTMSALDREINVEDNVYCIRVPLIELEELIDEEGSILVHFKLFNKPRTDSLSVEN